MKITCVVGARPNFIKIAPLMRVFHAHPEIEPLLVHTGQHYDERMSDLFFRELEIPMPDVNLAIGSGSHAVQTAEMMKAFELVVLEQSPDVVLVVGDVNSTIASGLVAVKLGVKLAHVEAGLRSNDRSMPEEINRVLTDAIADLLFCSEKSGVENLRHEGIPPDKIFFVGNVMIDTLLRFRGRAENSQILKRYRLRPREYAIMTLHRPSNVDDRHDFSRILDALRVIQEDIPIIFPLHPRTRRKLREMGLEIDPARTARLRTIEPVGYVDFLQLMAQARIVLTDSGGIQEETTVLGVPCLTLRNNTERPVTVEIGSNQLVGTRTEDILAGYWRAVNSETDSPTTPPLWDGHAAERIVEVLMR